jgi:hypothetical protein
MMAGRGETGPGDGRRWAALLRRFHRDERGAVLVLVALSAAALVSVVALAVDVGMLYVARAEAQRAADAAALAGASAFIDYDPLLLPAAARDTAVLRAESYATRHLLMREPITGAEVSTRVILDSAKVRVVVRREAVPLFFARIFGVEAVPVAATAAAVAADANETSCIKPFALPDLWVPEAASDLYRRGSAAPVWDFDAHLDPDFWDDDHCSRNRGCDPEVWGVGGYDPARGWGSSHRDGAPDHAGRTYQGDMGRRLPIKINYPTNSPYPSFWFPFQVGGAGVANYREAIKTCVPATFGVGGTISLDSNEQMEVSSQPGTFGKPTWDAIVDLIDNGDGTSAADRHARWDPATHAVVDSDYGANWKNSPRVIRVPIIDPRDMRSGQTDLRIVNFAELFLEDPRVAYSHISPNFKAPITVRLIRFGSGVLGAGAAGTGSGALIKTLRLVQ